jgi:hypothetical protein
METPEGTHEAFKPIYKLLKDNPVLNLDIHTFIPQIGLMYLQFNNMSKKIGDMQKQFLKIQWVVEENNRLLKQIKKSV